MKIYSSFLIALTFLVHPGCESINEDEVNIRIRNMSAYTMEDIRVSFPEQTITYASLDPGVVSPYRQPSKAYRYAYVEAVVQNKKAVVQPIDFFGEDYLESGKYTYEISIIDSSGQSSPENVYYYMGILLKTDN